MKKVLSMSFWPPYTPRQNGVTKRNNRTLIEMARTMLDEYKTSDRFSAEVVNMVCHATNRLYLHKLLKKTSYELLTGNKPNVLLRLMKVSYLVMIQTLTHTIFSMSPPVMLKPRVMRCLMRLMALKRSKSILI
jgi:hypothetical protein